MIEVTQLKDCKGADKFGSCISCGEYADDTFYRIKIYMGYGGTSIVLCPKCYKKLIEIMQEKIKC